MAEDQIESIIEYQDDIADAKAPSPLPIGKYHGEIVSVSSKTSQAKGNKYCEVWFRVGPEQYPADYVDGAPDGTRLAYRYVSPDNTATARWGMKRFLDTIKAPQGRTLNLADWIGKQATLDVVHEPYQGMDRANIKAVEPA